MEASSRQLWAVFCKTGYDVRACKLTKEQASDILDDKLDVATVAGAVQKRKAATIQTKWDAIYAEAHAAGMAAGQQAVPVPMVVVERANPLDDRSPVVRKYEPVMDGCCGFAWIVISGIGAFAKWAKEKGLASKHYPAGLSFWVGEFNQSLTRKEKYAYAFAEVLNKHGIKAYAGSRMD